MWYIWPFLGNKLKGWSHKLETLHEDNVGPSLKKARKQQICGGSPSLWISRLKNTNIFQIFAYPTLAKKYWDSVFKGNVQLVLSILCTSFLQPVWIVTDSLATSAAAEDFFNSYPTIDWKWNCKGENLQIFSSEIMLAWENGSQGHHFGKFLISKFLKGLTHSAMHKLSF